MAEKVDFELVSPERLLVSQTVDMVVVPGAEGYFGVLPGHSPMIASLKPGVIDMYEGERVIERLFVAGGFAEVTEKRCTVLAEEAVNVLAIDRAVAEKRVKDLTEDLSDSKSDDERAKLEGALLAAQAMLDAVAGTPAAH